MYQQLEKVSPFSIQGIRAGRRKLKKGIKYRKYLEMRKRFR